jgi:hypothetical protein
MHFIYSYFNFNANLISVCYSFYQKTFRGSQPGAREHHGALLISNSVL